MDVIITESPQKARMVAKAIFKKPGRTDEHSISSDGVTITWVVGHIFRLKNPDEYDPKLKHWSMDTLPIIPDRFEWTVAPKHRKLLSSIKRYCTNANKIILATDGDREGEVIGREVLGSFEYSAPVYRMWLRALDKKSVVTAYADLKPISSTDGLFHSGLARQRSDWLFGINMSRGVTLHHRANSTEPKNVPTMSIGRVQTPTLRLVVDRDRIIEHFAPRDHYVPAIDVTTNGATLRMLWQPADSMIHPPRFNEEGRCVDRSFAEGVVANSEGSSVTLNVLMNNKSEPSPLPYSLGMLQQVASKRLKMSAATTLATAQKLYMSGAISYPRTDCNYLPESQFADVPNIIGAIRATIELPATVALELSAPNRAFNDKKQTAHNAIVPTEQAPDFTKLDESARSLYRLIALRYVAQFAPPYRYAAITITTDLDGERYCAKERLPLTLGWRGLFDDQPKPESDGVNDVLAQTACDGDHGTVDGVTILTRTTKPPARYTEGTLISAMTNIAKLVDDPAIAHVLRDTDGIGTEATRASIIETLKKRKFVVTKNGKIVSTAVGQTLIDSIPDDIKSAGITALMEQGLSLIEAGSIDLDSYMKRQITFIKQHVQSLASN